MNRPALLRSIPAANQLAAQRDAANAASAHVLGLAWYRHFPGTTLSVARGWPMIAVGTYHTVRDLQWDTASLAADPELIRRLTGIPPKEWRAVWPLLEPHFPIDATGKRRNPELANQRVEAVGKRWQQVDAANVKHHRDDWYMGKSADLYRQQHMSGAGAGAHAGGSPGAGAGEGPHQHKHYIGKRDSYEGAKGSTERVGVATGARL